MFQLETEYFAWNFFDWAANFLLAVLLIFVVSTLVVKTWRVGRFAENDEQQELETVGGFESTVRNFRAALMEPWTGRVWGSIAAPIFMLFLFLTALYVR